MPEDSNSKRKTLDALKTNLIVTKDFLDLIKKIEDLPDIKKTAYTQTRSLYQAVSKGRGIEALEKILGPFFGEPAKPVGKPMPLLLRFNPSIKYLDGIREEQSLFIKKAKKGFYYGALWPWRRDPEQITVHLGFCSSKMSDKEFRRLEELVKSKTLHERIFEEFDEKIGAQVEGISLASFLHMAALEKMSCTLKITSGEKLGYLHLLNGDLIAAETGALKANKAAGQIVGWKNACISIDKPSGRTENEINRPIIQILTEAVKLDVAGGPAEEAPAGDDALPPELQVLMDDEWEPFQKPAAPKKLTRKAAVVLLAAALAIGLGTFFAVRVAKTRRIEADFRRTLAAVEAQQDLEVRLKTLRDFVSTHEPGKITRRADEKIAEILARIQKREFEQAMALAAGMREKENYESAAMVYRKVLARHPQSVHGHAARKALAETVRLADEKDYQTLVKPAHTDILAQALSCRQYLGKHPDGRHVDEAERLLAAIADAYRLAFSRQVSECNVSADWQTCVTLCENFLKIYPRQQGSEEARRRLAFFAAKRDDRRTLERLADDARQAGTDFGAAKNVYLDYLNRHPNASIKKDVLEALDAIKQREALARVQRAGEDAAARLRGLEKRFTDNRDQTVTDKRSGLMWSLLDSFGRLGKCLNYEQAARYVKDLETGGHRDWRLPTPAELAGIYRNKPSFPSAEPLWYWSSQSYSRYSDGWQTMVLTVSSDPGGGPEKSQADARECGAAHPVRP